MMVLLVILEQVDQGKVRLDDMVQVTKESSQMGGSQVYLDPSEQFSVEDLLYALAVQSANDAAVALAIHIAGSTEGFVALMNKKAQELGMKDTRFYSVHGLPPSKGQKPDETTARDLSLLSLALVKQPAIFEYTGTRERPFRDGKFIMRNHNHLLGFVDGCDGFKTGYFKAAGFSIISTAKKNGVRIVAIVMGSKDRKVRDAKAAELLAKGFALVPPKIEAATAVSRPEPVPEKLPVATSLEPGQSQLPSEQKEVETSSHGSWGMFFGGLAAGLLICSLLVLFMIKKQTRKKTNSRRYL